MAMWESLTEAVDLGKETTDLNGGGMAAVQVKSRVTHGEAAGGC